MPGVLMMDGMPLSSVIMLPDGAFFTIGPSASLQFGHSGSSLHGVHGEHVNMNYTNVLADVEIGVLTEPALAQTPQRFVGVRNLRWCSLGVHDRRPPPLALWAGLSSYLEGLDGRALALGRAHPVDFLPLEIAATRLLRPELHGFTRLQAGIVRLEPPGLPT